MTIRRRSLKRRKDLARLLAERVKNRRQQLGWNQKTLAVVCDVSLKSVQRIEQAAGLPALDCLYRIADGLGMRLSDLLAEDD
jgi:ribosome-binding protein aMBF1 (putative translation factor)